VLADELRECVEARDHVDRRIEQPLDLQAEGPRTDAPIAVEKYACAGWSSAVPSPTSVMKRRTSSGDVVLWSRSREEHDLAFLYMTHDLFGRSSSRPAPGTARGAM
jgi:hypothetical protein